MALLCQVEANAIAALGAHLTQAAAVPGVALPADMGAWVKAHAAALGLGGGPFSACGGLVAGIPATENGLASPDCLVLTCQPLTCPDLSGSA